MSAEQRISSADLPDGRRGPHVFAIEARALPLPTTIGDSLDREIEVALLTPPTVGPPFPIRVPRGTVRAGALFIVRCRNGRQAHLTLVRALSVTEPLGAGFDLATARVETPDTPESPTRSTDAASALQLRPAAAAHTHASGDQAKWLTRGCATAVPGIGATVAADTSVTVLTPPIRDALVTLAAPRGAISPGASFALRYFDASGAKRGLIHAHDVQAKPGMLDEVNGVLIGDPVSAPERQSYRAPIDLYFTATIEKHGGNRVVGRLIDLSSSGIGFRINATLSPGDRVQICDPSLPYIDGAEFEIVRTDPREPRRHGARFTERNRGARALATMLGLDSAERAHRRRIQVELAHLNGTATASPITPSDAQRLRPRGLTTRDRLRDVQPSGGYGSSP